MWVVGLWGWKLGILGYLSSPPVAYTSTLINNWREIFSYRPRIKEVSLIPWSPSWCGMEPGNRRPWTGRGEEVGSEGKDDMAVQGARASDRKQEKWSGGYVGSFLCQLAKVPAPQLIYVLLWRYWVDVINVNCQLTLKKIVLDSVDGPHPVHWNGP